MLHPAALAVRERAEALIGESQLGLASDADTFARGKVPAVLLAVARPFGSLVLAIDASEYDGLQVLKMAGFPDRPPLTAQQRLTGST